MSISQPFFCDRFTVEDFWTLGRLAKPPHIQRDSKQLFFEPVMMDPGGTKWKCSHYTGYLTNGRHQGQDYSCVEVRTARWKFAEQVYFMAYGPLLQRYPNITDLYWKDLLPNWREIQLPKNYSEAGDFMMEELERIARSGDILVDAGYSLRSRGRDLLNRSRVERATLDVVLDEENLLGDHIKDITGAMPGSIDRVPTKQNLSFGWNDIREFFHRPSPQMLELLNHSQSNPNVRHLDAAMIERVFNLDIDGALRLVDDGADINGANEQGETALSTLAEASYSGTIEMEPPPQPERIAMMRRLIAAGADVNRFYYSECDTLVMSTLQAEPETVQFLLEEAGADPNHNTFPEDDPEGISQALDYAASDCNIYDGEHLKACEKIYDLLIKHGAVFRRPQEETSR